jgi:hypothetical protein
LFIFVKNKNMNTTTYNLSPEEKMSVFTSKYRNLESPTRDES